MRPRAGAETTCPLCRASFDADRSDCHSGCPLARGCRVLCCPRCGYEFVEESAIAGTLERWSRKLFGRGDGDGSQDR